MWAFKIRFNYTTPLAVSQFDLLANANSISGALTANGCTRKLIPV
jgi:hypothetical protein